MTKIAVTITARADRDDSCNLYNLSETHYFRLSDPPSAGTITDLCIAHKEKFIESWPHRRQTPPMLVPLDVDVREVEGTVAGTERM